MRKTLPGFHLLDSLLAVSVVLLGAGAAIGLEQQSRNAFFRYCERARAHEILNHARGLSYEELSALSTRYYDFHGLPVAHEGKFRLEVESESLMQGTRFLCRVRYRDADGKTREISLERWIWRPHEGV